MNHTNRLDAKNDTEPVLCILPPKSFSQIQHAKAVFLPVCQRYQQRVKILDIYGNYVTLTALENIFQIEFMSFRISYSNKLKIIRIIVDLFEKIVIIRAGDKNAFERLDRVN